MEEAQQNAIVRAWKDPEYKKRLLTHPREAFREIGFPVPEQVHIHVYEGRENTWSFVLPPSPHGSKTLSEAELRKLAAAGSMPANIERLY